MGRMFRFLFLSEYKSKEWEELEVFDRKAPSAQGWKDLTYLQAMEDIKAALRPEGGPSELKDLPRFYCHYYQNKATPNGLSLQPWNVPASDSYMDWEHTDSM